MYLDVVDQLSFLFLVGTFPPTVSEHPLPSQMLPHHSWSSPSCLFGLLQENGCGRGEKKTYSIFRKTVNISLFLTKHTLFTLECKYFMTCNWQFWNILVRLENCNSVKNPIWHTQLIFSLHNALKKHLTLRTEGVMESIFHRGLEDQILKPRQHICMDRGSWELKQPRTSLHCRPTQWSSYQDQMGLVSSCREKGRHTHNQLIRMLTIWLRVESEQKPFTIRKGRKSAPALE